MRKVRRAAITVAHPGSSLEGAAKAGLSRSVGGASRRRRQSKQSSGAGGALVIALIVIALIWAGLSSTYHAVFGPHVKRGPQAWIAGAVRDESSSDYSTITVTGVRCRWNGSHVEAQMRVRNKQPNAISLTVSPQYTIAGHGSHGGSIDSYTNIGIRRQATKTVLVDAGKPQGVSGQPAITSCGPDLVGLSSW